MLDKTIRAIQFIARPAVRYTTQAVAYTAKHTVPKTKEVIDTWNREWKTSVHRDDVLSSLKIQAPDLYAKIQKLGLDEAFKEDLPEFPEVHTQVKPKASEKDSGDVGICNFCCGPYIDGNCQEYQCHS
tara:strand:- start:120 stop:503 length:384 start_codon:yes stop_codon:yes gene_type:complete